jgi:hypothetical protein
VSDTRMKIHTGEQRDGEASVPITITATSGMRRRISSLCETGIYGTTVEEVAERLICRQLQEMEAR